VTPEELKRRTKAFGLSTIKLVDQLPRTRSANVIKPTAELRNVGRGELPCGLPSKIQSRICCETGSR
jgi:hypothetical protein